MVIRADDLALLDLGQDPRPWHARHDHRADLMAFVALMVKVQHHDIGLAAVHARMIRQVSEDVLPGLAPDTRMRLSVRAGSASTGS